MESLELLAVLMHVLVRRIEVCARLRGTLRAQQLDLVIGISWVKKPDWTEASLRVFVKSDPWVLECISWWV